MKSDAISAIAWIRHGCKISGLSFVKQNDIKRALINRNGL